MRHGTAQARAPQVALRRRNFQAEANGLQQALLCLLQYTPDITLLGPHSLAIEVSASLALFGGPRALWRKADQALQGLGLNVRLAMAPTAQGAWALALQEQTFQRRVLKPGTLAQRLDPLHISCLPALAPWQEWLEGVGCHTLGHLRSLPRKGLQQRTGPELMQTLDAAYGYCSSPHAWVTLPDTFRRRYETLHNLQHTHAILAVAGSLINQLCGWLQAAHRSACRLIFILHHEKGRHAQAPTRLEIELLQAGWQPDDFLTVTAERLNRLTLPEHVIAVELQVNETQERTPHSQSLFPEPAHWAQQENRLLDLLRSRLGEKRIFLAQPVASHLPESINRWVFASSSCSTQAGAVTGGFLPGLPEQARPFWLFNPPLQLSTHRDTPVYQGLRLRLIQGPERIESGWWNQQQQQRDYFVAQDTQYGRYWIYRQRGSFEARWFLHGLFG